jgi:predicted acyl esterase
MAKALRACARVVRAFRLAAKVVASFLSALAERPLRSVLLLWVGVMLDGFGLPPVRRFFPSALRWLGRKLLARGVGLPPPMHQWTEESIKTCDELVATLLLPKGATGRLPTVVIRTPYGRQNDFGQYFLVERGYAVVVQDTRGRFGSGGDFVPVENERADGARTIAWVRSQKWCNGRIGVTGISYLGFTAWGCVDKDSGVDAIAPVISQSRVRPAMFQDGGAISSELCTLWFFLVLYLMRGFPGPVVFSLRLLGEFWYETIRKSYSGEVPFGEVDRVVLGDALKYWQEGVRSLEPGCRWWDGKDYLCPVLRDSELCPPCHILTGWYDFFLQGALEDYRRAARVQPAVRLTVGGFGHWGTVLYPDLVHNCVLDVFERHLKGKDYRWLPISAPGEEPPPSRRSTDAPVQAFCIGLGWRGYKTWPPPAAEVVFGLDSQGTLVPAAVDGVAASREHSVVRLPKKDAAKGGEGHGEGLTDLTPSDETAGIEDERSGATASSLQSQATNALLPAAPLSEESSFTFVYDPRDPTPCAGGPSFNPMNGGRHAQGDVERRKDVLLFTSAPLPEGMLIVSFAGCSIDQLPSFKPPHTRSCRF